MCDPCRLRIPEAQEPPACRRGALLARVPGSLRRSEGTRSGATGSEFTSAWWAAPSGGRRSDLLSTTGKKALSSRWRRCVRCRCCRRTTDPAQPPRLFPARTWVDGPLAGLPRVKLRRRAPRDGGPQVSPLHLPRVPVRFPRGPGPQRAQPQPPHAEGSDVSQVPCPRCQAQSPPRSRPCDARGQRRARGWGLAPPDGKWSPSLP